MTAVGDTGARSTISLPDRPRAALDISDWFTGYGPDDQFLIDNIAVAQNDAMGGVLILFQITRWQAADWRGPSDARLVLARLDEAGRLEDVSDALHGLEPGGNLGSMIRKIATGDVNGDGLPDFAFANNREDGRAWGWDDSGGFWDVTARALLSRAEGGYDVAAFGDRVYRHSVAIVDGAVALDDGSLHRAEDGAMVEAADWSDPPLGNAAFGADARGRFAIAETSGALGIGMAFARSDGAGPYEVREMREPPVERTVLVAMGSEDGIPGEPFYRYATTMVDGAEHFVQAFFQQELVRLEGIGRPVAVFKASIGRLGAVLGERDDGEGGTLPAFAPGDAFQHFLFFEVGADGLIPRPDLFPGPPIPNNVNFYGFHDLDGDGLKDMIAYAINEDPVVFLRTPEGAFEPFALERAPELARGRNEMIFETPDGALLMVSTPGNFFSTESGVALTVEIETIRDSAARPGVTRAATGTDGPDLFAGGAWDDHVALGGGDDRARGGAGDDLIEGGDGDDLILSGDGNDTILGDDGNDILKPGRGDDSMDGGAGDDILVGFRGDETLIGGEGNDTLLGNLDDDTIIGGAGDDRLQGGPGRDVFVFDALEFGQDRIVLDFRPGSDAIDFRGSGLRRDDLEISETAGKVKISVIGHDSSIVVAADRIGPLSVEDFDDGVLIF